MERDGPINIVIPMAGAGSRFAVAGYDAPKPFIRFKGRMMIEHVLGSFAKLDARVVLVVQEGFLASQRDSLEELKRSYSFTTVTVPGLTMGAAVTALAAHKAVDAAYDIIFADCDNIFDGADMLSFVEDMRGRDLDGGLLTFASSEPCFSYARTGGDGMVLETREKEVISSHAICGAYYFKSVDLFRDAAIDLIVSNDLQKGEFYMSSVYNHLRKATARIGVFDIAGFDCVGTPGQLAEFIGG